MNHRKPAAHATRIVRVNVTAGMAIATMGKIALHVTPIANPPVFVVMAGVIMVKPADHAAATVDLAPIVGMVGATATKNVTIAVLIVELLHPGRLVIWSTLLLGKNCFAFPKLIQMPDSRFEKISDQEENLVTELRGQGC